MTKNLRLKAARAMKDMTQKALADAVGVSRQTINAIETGDYNPTIKMCRDICRVLERSLDDLFGASTGPEGVTGGILSETGAKLLMEISWLTVGIVYLAKLRGLGSSSCP